MEKVCLKCKKKNRCPLNNGKKRSFAPGVIGKGIAKYCKRYEPIKK